MTNVIEPGSEGVSLRHARFAHLHVHSEFTFGESALSLEAIVAAARRHRFPAIAITDHNNLHGAAEFSRLAWEGGVKPIIGCELTVSREDQGEPFHLVLLARNQDGYGNLCRLITAAHEVAIRAPACPWEALEQHHQGLVALTACGRGLVGQHLSSDDTAAVRTGLEDLKALFEDDLFLELQHHGRAEDDLFVRKALELARELGLPPVAASNCRWADDTGQRALNALWASQEKGKGLALMYGGDFSICDADTLAARFAECPEALANTLKVADRCRLILVDPDQEPKPPPLPAPPGVEGARQTLRERAWAGLEARLPTAGFVERRFRRLEQELDSLGPDVGRMLCLADVQQRADDLGVVTAADRGDPAGSVLAFALGLSDVDPVRHDIRGLNRRVRVSLAVGPARRSELLDELVRGWSGGEALGEVRAARLISYHRHPIRTLVRDLAPALSASDDAIKDALAALEGEERANPPPGTPAVALTETCRVLEGLARKTTLNPSALVLAREPLGALVPLSRSDLDLPVAQVDDATARVLGLPVLDLRGTRLLDVLGLTRDLVRDGRGEEVRLRGLAEDPAGLRLIARGETHGVPMLESRSARELAARLAPASLQEVAVLIALHRQAPRREGIERMYVERARGEVPVPSLHPRADPLLADTLGFILFREQVSQVAEALVRCTTAQARQLLEAIEAGEGSALEAEQQRFLDAARRRRVKPELASSVFRRLASFARYGFSRAQAISAAALAVTAAAVKARYRPEFTAAMIAVGSGSAAQVAEILEEAAAGGLTVLPPDVNAGGAEATVEQGRLRLGLSHVLGVGEATALDVVAERMRNGPFKGLDDLLTRAGPPVLGRRAARGLVLAGACDGFGEGRDVLLSRLARQTWRGGRRQTDLFAGMEAARKDGDQNTNTATAEQGEREALGFSIADLPGAARSQPTLAEIAFSAEDEEVGASGEVLSLREGIGRAADRVAVMLWDGTGLVEVESRAGERVPALGGWLRATGRLRRAGEGRPAALVDATCSGAIGPAHAILLVRVPGGTEDPTLLRRLRRVLGDHPGEMRVHLHVATDDRSVVTWALPDNTGIKLDKSLLRRLEELLGEGSWKILEKKEGSAE